MKKVVFVLAFLMLANGVLAMDDPIGVGTESGNEVKIYVWPAEVGQILDSRKGVVDENGIFEATFFSLNVPSYRLQIIVIDSDGEKIRDDKFAGMNTSGSVFIDCVPSVCEISVREIVEEIENETVVEVVENETSEEGGFSLSGKAIFSNEDGSINWSYSIGGFAVLLCLIVFIFGILHHGKAKRGDVLGDDEKELQYMEKKVRETEKKIRSVKEGKERKVKIENAKRKLAEEEAELKELEAAGNDNKIEKQEDVVEKAEDKVEKVEG